VFWSIVVGVVALIVLGFAIRGEARREFTWLTAFVAVFGAVVAVFVHWVRRRPLRATDPATLARSYVARVLLGAALAETPVAVGFAGTLVSGEPWPSLLGGGWGLAALSFVAPTDADLDRRQAELDGSGAAISLRDALATGGV
jgi:hypothetical protein